MKTIREHLETLPEPWRTQALENTPKEKQAEDSPSLVHSLFNAFAWSESPQGEDPWHAIWMQAKQGPVTLTIELVAFSLMSRLEAHQTERCTCGVEGCPRCAVYEGDLAVINQYKALPESSR